MLRVLFTAEDLARTRLRAHPDPLWEITNSFQILRSRHGRAVFGAWRQTTRERLSPTSRLLAPLLPPAGYSPDFLTPDLGDEDADLEAAIDLVLSTSSGRLRDDLGRLAAEHRPLGWATALRDSEPGAVDRLGDALRTYHAEALAPYWSRVQAHVRADQALHLRSLSDGGTEGLLANLTPGVRWRPPVLEVDYPVHRTLRLSGRGLTLQPSLFCWRRPVMVSDPALAPVLVYPLQHHASWQADPAKHPAEDRPNPLGALIGRTRAAVLDIARTGVTTSELASRLDVSRAAISQHTGVLRDAGLLVTIRTAGHAFHVATSEGRALLRTASR